MPEIMQVQKFARGRAEMQTPVARLAVAIAGNNKVIPTMLHLANRTLC